MTKAEFMRTFPWPSGWTWLDSTGIIQMHGRRVARVELIDRGYQSRYDRLEVTVINKDEGEIDRKSFYFDDYMVDRQDNRPDYTGGFYCWSGGAGRTGFGWYIAVPKKRELEKLVVAVSRYIEELT